ncbi:hypothetical protein SOV_04850 [Sporomusa ovata DSM 2662]|uniref:Phage-related protein n=1 Tax=Sporomusa ovata TaxID=2378 RepID=A0A0U1KX53_9FIRM|nr:Gp138 family membrane-puncturing spike protein [Sporomusa ovata]EQB28155.1 hypothetical protein SOV_2c10780 [Sporomusa ovata DSM 2662]CQR71689.1 Phage-related protein [Sporomusa ovata]
MYSIPERLKEDNDLYRKMLSSLATNLRVAMPGIIESYDPATQTATIQPAIREKVNINGNQEWTNIPLLVDVPILFPRAGGYAITFPVSAGDECLVFFADCCYDAFWQSGGVQNQIDRRRHDLSDGLAIVTGISQPNKLSSVSSSGLQIRNDTGSAVIEIVGGNISINSGNISIGPNTTIDGRLFLSHTHSGVLSGSSNTGGVV